MPGTHTYHAAEYLSPQNPLAVAGTSLMKPNQWTFNGTPSVVTGSASGRAVPDVSADADPYSGYLLYAPSFAQAGEPALAGRLGRHQLRGAAAERGGRGHRLGPGPPDRVLEPGPSTPWRSGPDSPFTELDQAGTGNDNL